MIRKITKNEYRMIPRFLEIDFNEGKCFKSIRNFVIELYHNRRIDIIVKIYLFLYPKNNYLILHGYDDICDPNYEFFRENEWESTLDKINWHMNIDINFLIVKKDELKKFQKEILEILTSINESKELNDDIASTYVEESNLDAQIIWRYHRELFIRSSKIILDRDIDKLLKKPKWRSEIIEKFSSWELESIETSSELKIDEEYLSCIREIEKQPSNYGLESIEGMPPFDSEKYIKILNIWDSHPHINRKESRDIVIADFAGNLTGKLERKLKNIHPKIGKPVKYAKNGSWHYTLDQTEDFVSLLYSHLVEYCVNMFEEVGWLTRCEWCGQFLNPDNYQIAHLRKGRSIYCKSYVSDVRDTCQEKARIHNQKIARKNKKAINDVINEKEKG